MEDVHDSFLESVDVHASAITALGNDNSIYEL